MQPTSINPIWLLLWCLGLRRIVGLLISTWREVLGSWASPAVPNTGESLWMWDSSLEWGAAGEAWLWRWEVVKLFLVFKAIAIIFLVAACPLLSWVQWYTRTVSWYWCWSWSIILSKACKFQEEDDLASAKGSALNIHFNPADSASKQT